MSLFFSRTGRVGHFGRSRHLITQTLDLWQIGLVIAYATDRIFRRVDVEIRHDDELDIGLIFERTQPLALFIDEISGHIDRHFSDDLGGSIFANLFADESQDGECHRFYRADTADALAARTHFMARVREGWTQSLTRHLEQPKARQATDLDARAVHFHGIAQAILDSALILRLLHVDEVDDDQTADVADTQLPRDFVSGLEIGIGSGGFDVTTARGTRRVDIDRDERLGVVDDDRATRG